MDCIFHISHNQNPKDIIVLPKYTNKIKLISMDTKLYKPLEVKNCIISWPVANPEPIINAIKAPAIFITFKYINIIFSHTTPPINKNF